MRYLILVLCLSLVGCTENPSFYTTRIGDDVYLKCIADDFDRDNIRKDELIKTMIYYKLDTSTEYKIENNVSKLIEE